MSTGSNTLTRIIAGLALLWLLPSIAAAQSTAPPAVIGYLSTTGCPYGQTSCFVQYGSSVPTTGGSGGGASPPYVATPEGFQQVSVGGTAVGFTAPAGATFCYVEAESAAVRERDDGPSPTATVGALLPVTTTSSISQMILSITSLATAKFIATSGTATLDVGCYK